MFGRSSNTALIEGAFSANPWIPINFKKLMGDIPIKGKSILIVGANSGYEADLFLLAGAKRVVGIDVFYAMVMYRHRKYKFLLSPGEEMPFSDDHFDVVYSQAVLEHVADIHQTWKESYRVLKPGGFIAHMASPIWFSRDGHHRPDLFAQFPWCHIGRSSEEWESWILQNDFFEGRHGEVISAAKYCSSKVNIN